MATADSVKAKIQGLIDTANETTQQNDTTLTDAVNHLKEGYGQGGDNHYDTFWDSFQLNGERRNYGYSFAGEGWNNSTFKPKYPIVAVGEASYMFNEFGVTDFDFVEEGVSLDLSGVTTMTYLFRNCSGVKRVGTIDCSKCKDLNRLFYQCKIQTIDNFIVHENLTFSNTFDYASSLENLTVSGTIGKNGLNLSSAKNLSKASIESIINALSTTTSGLTVTLSQAAIDRISNIGEENESYLWWWELTDTRQNWTITLA